MAAIRDNHVIFDQGCLSVTAGSVLAWAESQANLCAPVDYPEKELRMP